MCDCTQIFTFNGYLHSLSWSSYIDWAHSHSIIPTLESLSLHFNLSLFLSARTIFYSFLCKFHNLGKSSQVISFSFCKIIFFLKIFSYKREGIFCDTKESHIFSKRMTRILQKQSYERLIEKWMKKYWMKHNEHSILYGRPAL